MARRGTFGRIPRAAPDLTNTLVALIREAAAQQDQNMVDAWKNGGKVDGKGVDDERLLAHMKMRRDNLDPSDPNWDEWNNNYIQYDFSIHESKMALANDQGKVSDKQMAAFYTKWANRSDVQQDSEFYRSLLSRAAKWNAAAKGRAAGNSARAAAEAHNKWVAGYYKSHVAGAETATGYLLFIAKEYGAAPPSANSLADIDANSAGYAKFLDVIDNGKSEGNPAVQGAIDLMNAEIKKVNPNWTYSRQNLTDLLNRGEAGLNKLGDESTTDTERKQWAKRRGDLRFEAARVRQAEANEHVQIAADNFVIDLKNCNGDPYCARNATKTLRDKLAAETKNIVAAPGGLGVDTTDIKTASALANTISQLDANLSGKDVQPPAAVAGQAGAGKTAPTDYTIFDAAAGNSSAGGYLGNTLNGVNGDMTRLDGGGWMSTEMVPTGNGNVLLDGHGQPVFEYHIHDAGEPTPPGAIAIPGTTMMTDGTRSSVDPTTGAPGAHSVTPTIYAVPTPANISFVDEKGNRIDPKVTGDVKLSSGGAAAGPPWVEINGIKGPDGVTRTLFRTGDGSVGNPYLFHEQPPVDVAGPNAFTKNAAGQIQVTVKPGVDEKGNPVNNADISGLVNGVKKAREPLPSGNFVLGTYSSAGATQASLAIGDLFHRNDPDASAKADSYVRNLGLGIAGMPWNDPERNNALRDMKQLQQRVDLYKTGKADKVLGDAYTEANALKPQTQGYLDQLGKAGITAQKYGQDEIDRRISLLTGIDAADDRLLASSQSGAFNTGGPGGLGRGGVGRGMYGYMGGTLATNAAQQKADLEAARLGVLNPTISVSNIKIPGMPNQFAPTATVDLYGRTIYNGGIPAPMTPTASPGTSPNIPGAPNLPGPKTPPPPPPKPQTTATPPAVKVPPPPIPTPNGPVYVPPSGYIPASGAGYVPPPPPDTGGGDKWKNQ